MIDANDLVVAFKDKKNKAIFNNQLLKMFKEFGGAEKDALPQIMDVLKAAEIDCKRASVIGKLGVMGVKSIVKPKVKSTKKKDEGPSKKDLIAELLPLLGLSVNDLTTLPNLKKADIQTLIDCYTELVGEEVKK